MPRNKLQRYLPTRQQLRENKSLQLFGSLLQNNDVWHLNRRSAAGAMFIGLFCAFIPIPFQMVVAAAFAVWFRCNLPLSVALVWISNPITMPPMFYFTYRLGAWLLNMELAVSNIDLSFGWLLDNFVQIGYPLLFGSLLCGWVAGTLGFVITHLVWRIQVAARWRERREQRRQRKQATSSSVQSLDR